MKYKKALVYSMEYLEQNFDWLQEKIESNKGEFL